MYRANIASDRGVLLSAFGGKLFGLDRMTGHSRWAVELEGGSEVELAVEGDTVIACTWRRLTFIRYSDGQVLKQITLAGEYPYRPVMLVDDGQIFVARNGEVSCYTLQGDLIWLQPFKGLGLGAVALALPGNVRQADGVGSR